VSRNEPSPDVVILLMRSRVAGSPGSSGLSDYLEKYI